MNIIEYAIRLGKAIRKTPEGRELMDCYTLVLEKYNNENHNFYQYRELVDHKSSYDHFFAWIIAYDIFEDLLEKPVEENTRMFLETAKLVVADPQIKKLADTAKIIGQITENISQVMITTKEISDIKELTLSSKVKNAVVDLQMAMQRTGVILFIIRKCQEKKDYFDMPEYSEYCKNREDSKLTPYSQEAYNFIYQNSKINDDYKECIERIMLLRYAMKKGIFEGFFGNVKNIRDSELIEFSDVEVDKIKEITFIHTNIVEELRNKKTWLYKINSGKLYYVLANQKEMHFCGVQEKVTVKGIIYPSEDVGFFEQETIK